MSSRPNTTNTSTGFTKFQGIASLASLVVALLVMIFVDRLDIPGLWRPILADTSIIVIMAGLGDLIGYCLGYRLSPTKELVVVFWVGGFAFVIGFFIFVLGTGFLSDFESWLACVVKSVAVIGFASLFMGCMINGALSVTKTGKPPPEG